MSDEAHWLPCIFKGRKVFAEATPDGTLLERDGRVAIVYRMGADRSYRTFASRLAPAKGAQVVTGAAAPPPPPEDEGGSKGPTRRTATKTRRGAGGKKDSAILGGKPADLTDPEAIHIWTDGACSGNPGPAGAGTIVLRGDHRLDIATFLGPSTNNVAELTAILVGLRQVPRDDPRTLVLHTDSQYCIGVLARGWKAKTNVALIQRIQKLVERHPRFVWHWVRGHEGVELNEAADQLARAAVAAEDSFRNERGGEG